MTTKFRGLRRRVRRFLGKLEGHQNTPPDFDRILETLQTGCEFFPFLVPKVGVARASRDDQVVIMNLALPRPHDTRYDIDGLHFGENHLNVFVFSKNTAHRAGNVRRREGSGRDLIKERLKEVIVGAIDDRHVHWFVGQVFGRLEAAEAGTDNHDVRAGCFWGFHRRMIAGLAGW